MMGFDETTKKGNPGITSNMIIEPTEGAPLEPVILRGAYCSAGGTSEAIAAAIEAKCFSRLRDFLTRWKAKFQSMCAHSHARMPARMPARSRTAGA